MLEKIKPVLAINWVDGDGCEKSFWSLMVTG